MPLKDENKDSRGKSSKTSFKSAIKKVSQMSAASRAFSNSTSRVTIAEDAKFRSGSIVLENGSLLKSVLSTRSRSQSVGTNVASASTTGAQTRNVSKTKISDNPESEAPSEFRFAPEVITSVREYCNQEPPNFLLINSDQPLYEPLNFKLDENDKIVRESSTISLEDLTKETDRSIRNTPDHSQQNSATTSTLTLSKDKDLLRKKVRLESLKISKYHLNGFITCASLSLDQSCYIRVSCDNWNTFQESQAIEIGDFNINTPTQYQFDFLIPIDRNIDENLNSSLSQASRASRHEIPGSITSGGSSMKLRSGNHTVTNSATELAASTSVRDEEWQVTLRRAPAKLEIMVVLNGFRGLFYYDTNGGVKYSLVKKNLAKKKTNLKTVAHSD